MNHVNVNEIRCQQALALIAEYLDRELTSTDRWQLERHIETCRHCYDRVEFERLLKSRLTSLRVGVPSPALHKTVESLLESFT
jgi:anti-sigma factor (TIGR02949 family)